METIKNIEDLKKLKENKIIGSCNLNNSTINFSGKDNILFFEDGVTLLNSTINFECNNSVIYLSKSRHDYKLNVMIYEESVFYVGKDNYFNGIINISISERTNVIIGSEGLYSFDIWMRTADPHLIYDIANGKRLNPSKGIFIGDHVWIGQRSMILKGTKIGSGSIIGAMSLVSGKTIPSNESWAGSPARMCKQNVFFTSSSVHKYTEEMTIKQQVNSSKKYIYNSTEKTLNFATIDKELSLLKNSSEKLSYAIDKLAEKSEKNKFSITSMNKIIIKKKAISQIIKKVKRKLKIIKKN